MSFYDSANKFGAFFGEPPLPKIETVNIPVYGFSPSFLAQIEADRIEFEKRDAKEKP
jgi:hypothetical protein